VITAGAAVRGHAAPGHADAGELGAEGRLAVRRPSRRKGGSHVRLWAAISGGEVVVRLLLQVITTAVLARLLDPEDFGLSTLALTLVTIFSVFTAMPFEEALAQRRIIRGAHVRATLAASWLGSAFFLLLSFAAGLAIDRAFSTHGMTMVLPAATLMLFPNTVVVLGTAVARRRRDFNAVALSSLIGNVTGAVCAIALGLAGGGIWALIAFRTVTVLAQAVAIVALERFSLSPRWSLPHLRDLSYFAWYVLWERLVDNLSYLVFNYLVGALFGLAVLGQFNMAMRVIEPIRGAVIAIGHNLAFALFLPCRDDPKLLAQSVRNACRRLSSVVAPAFLGLAAVAPLLLPVFAGPGWEEAVPLTQLFAIGSALFCSTQLLMTGLTVAGEPQHLLYRGLARFVVTTGGLLALSGFGAVFVGVCRLLADACDSLIALILSVSRLGLGRFRLAADLARPLGIAALMGVAVAAAGPPLAHALGTLLALCASVGLGMAVYMVLLALLDRTSFLDLKSDLIGRRRAGPG